MFFFLDFDDREKMSKKNTKDDDDDDDDDDEDDEEFKKNQQRILNLIKGEGSSSNSNSNNRNEREREKEEEEEEELEKERLRLEKEKKEKEELKVTESVINLFRLIDLGLSNVGPDNTGKFVIGNNFALSDKSKTVILFKYLSDRKVRIFDEGTSIITIVVGVTNVKSAFASVTFADGHVGLFGGVDGILPTSDCRIFNLATRIFFGLSDLPQPRHSASAALMLNGTVFISGGVTRVNNQFVFLNSCLVFSRTNNVFNQSNALLRVARGKHASCLLPNGKVFVCGGMVRLFPLNSCEIYDPSTDSFVDGPDMHVSRFDHTATLLMNGLVLVCGGADDRSSEFYNPNSNRFTLGPTMLRVRYQHTASLLSTGKVLICGGDGGEGTVNRTEVYHPDERSSQGLFTFGYSFPV